VIEAGTEISPAFDSLLGKLVTWGTDRQQAIRRMERALSELKISGITSTIGFHRRVMAHHVFKSGDYDTRFLERYPEVLETDEREGEHVAPAGATAVANSVEDVMIEINGRRFDVRVHRSGKPSSQRRPQGLAASGGAPAMAVDGTESIVSPIQGTVLSVAVAQGDTVRAGDVVCVIEAMKMENEISAGRDGTVSRLDVVPGTTIQSGALIAVIESGNPSAAE
jgi:acetyl-CoA/propionyl-CoA carboxylase, biotin carboxylase, biotin carboxyl carrier protein